MPESSQNVAAEDYPVPLFGRWRNAYLAIVVIFVLEVGFFYFVGHFFS